MAARGIERRRVCAEDHVAEGDGAKRDACRGPGDRRAERAPADLEGAADDPPSRAGENGEAAEREADQ